MRVLEEAADVTLVRRCADVAELLSAGAAGVARVAVVSPDLRGLDRDALRHLAGHGVRVAGAGRRPTTRRASGGCVSSGSRRSCARSTTRPPWPRALVALAGATTSGDAGGRRHGGRRRASACGRGRGRRRRRSSEAARRPRPRRPEDHVPTPVTVGLGPDRRPGPHHGRGHPRGPAGRRRRAHPARRPRHLGRQRRPGARPGRRGTRAWPRRPAPPSRAPSTCPASPGWRPRWCPGLRVLTGLPRADRWPELRTAAVEDVLRLARGVADHVVVDTGFAVEDDEELSYDTAAPRRNAATLTALEASDQLVVVGAADPVGLQRLVRAVQDVAVLPSPRPTIVVTKVRASVAGRRPRARHRATCCVASPGWMPSASSRGRPTSATRPCWPDARWSRSRRGPTSRVAVGRARRGPRPARGRRRQRAAAARHPGPGGALRGDEAVRASSQGRSAPPHRLTR